MFRVCTGKHSDHKGLRHEELEVEVLAVALGAAPAAATGRKTLLHARHHRRSCIKPQPERQGVVGGGAGNALKGKYSFQALIFPGVVELVGVQTCNRCDMRCKEMMALTRRTKGNLEARDRNLAVCDLGGRERKEPGHSVTASCPSRNGTASIM